MSKDRQYFLRCHMGLLFYLMCIMFSFLLVLWADTNHTLQFGDNTFLFELGTVLVDGCM